MFKQMKVAQFGQTKIKPIKNEAEEEKTQFIHTSEQREIECRDSCLRFIHCESEEEQYSDDEENQAKKPLQLGLFENIESKESQYEVQASLQSKLIQKIELGDLMKKDMATVNNEQLEKDAKFRYLREMKHKPNLIKSIFDPEY